MITSRQNSRVRDLRAALRGRADDGMAAVEGPTLLHEAMAAGLAVPTIYLREDRQHLGSNLPVDTEVVVLSSEVFESAAATEQAQGVAAMVRKPIAAYAPRRGDLLVIAAALQDPGNLGTLVRSAEALGASAVILAEQTVDPWNGKALRASAGSIFRMPLPRWTDALATALRRCGIRLLAAVPDREGAVSARALSLTEGCAFLIGNEGNGLSAAMLALADGRVTLPMPGPTESLNAAVAGSLLLYEAARQRGAGA